MLVEHSAVTKMVGIKRDIINIMRLRHLRLITVLTINQEARLWKGKLIVRGITATKFLLEEEFLIFIKKSINSYSIF